MIRDFVELILRVRSGKRRTVALIAAHDRHALQAVLAARDFADAVLVGEPEKIRGALKELGEDPNEFEIVQPPEGENPAIAAARLIHDGRADFLMKGSIMTDVLLRGVLDQRANLRNGGLMSHLMLLQVPGYPKLLGLTDGAMCPHPDLEQKRKIVENAVGFFHRIGYERPAVAALCAAENINPRMPETLEAAELVNMSRDGCLKGCYVEGPISYDLAMMPEIGKRKGYHSPYAGNFDLLLAPEITAGNSLFKCIVYTAGGKSAGLILGCKVPIVLTSRGSSAEEKYYSLALGAGMCGEE